MTRPSFPNRRQAAGALINLKYWAPIVKAAGFTAD